MVLGFFGDASAVYVVLGDVCVVDVAFGDVSVVGVVFGDVSLVDVVFIGPESDHWQCLSLTHSLTD